MKQERFNVVTETNTEVQRGGLQDGFKTSLFGLAALCVYSCGGLSRTAGFGFVP